MTLGGCCNFISRSRRVRRRWLERPARCSRRSCPGGSEGARRPGGLLDKVNDLGDGGCIFVAGHHNRSGDNEARRASLLTVNGVSRHAELSAGRSASRAQKADDRHKAMCTSSARVEYFGRVRRCPTSEGRRTRPAPVRGQRHRKLPAVGSALTHARSIVFLNMRTRGGERLISDPLQRRERSPELCGHCS